MRNADTHCGFKNFTIEPGAFRKLPLAVGFSLAFAFFLLMPQRVEAASKFWIASGSGNLNDNANWSLTSGGSANTTAPGASDSARFDGNGLGNCTITTNVTLQSMLIGSGYSGTITVATGVDLTFGPFSFFQMDAGTFNTSNGTFFMNAGEGFGSFTQNGGVFNGNGTVDLNVANVTLNGGLFNATDGNTTFHRSFTRNAGGNFDPRNGTAIFMAQPGGGMNFSAPATTEIFNNLILNNTGNFVIGGTAEVSGALTLNSGTFASGTLDAKGVVTIAAPSIATNGLLQITGADTRIISFAAGANIPNIILNAPNVTVETSGSGTINWRSLTLQAGIINQGPVNFVFSGSYSQSGGTVNGGNGTFSVNPGLLGTFDQSGGDFNGNGTIDLNVSNATFSGGTFHATQGNTTFHRGFTRSAGIFDPNSGTVIFETQPGTGIALSSPATQTFNNLTLNNSGNNFSLGGTAVVLGTLTLASGLVNGGTFQAQGDVVVQNTFGFGTPLTGGTTSIRFSASNNQTFTNNGGANPTGTWTVDKSGRKVTLASDLTLGVTQVLNITSGTLDQGASFNLTAGAITIGSAGGASGRLTNQGTGDLTLGGTLTVNSGSTMTLNSGGGSCGDADSILIRSSVDGIKRTWTGSGNFFLTDVDLKDQSAGNPPGIITVFNGTDQPTGGPSSNSNFVFVSICNPTAASSAISGLIFDDSGNPVEGAVVRLTGTQNRSLITDAQGFYRFDNVETNGFYTVTPSRVNFSFNPSERSFSQFGNQTEAAFIGLPNGGNLNPLDSTGYFVRQQYLDFLGREPDEEGFNFWSINVEHCGADLDCREVARINTSAAFFLSIEFQRTGLLVHQTYKAAYGDMGGAPVPLTLAAFKPDANAIRHGVVVNQPGWEQTLEQNTSAFVNEFVQRPRFSAEYPLALSPAEFVTRLFEHAGVTPSEIARDEAIAEFGSAIDASEIAARGRALRRVAENPTLARQEFNKAFVLMQYFGYLQRDPNGGPDTNFAGYNFWLTKLNSFGGDYQSAEMVKAFLLATEYRRRFPQ